MIRYHGTRGITLWWTFWLLAAPARLAAAVRMILRRTK